MRAITLLGRRWPLLGPLARAALRGGAGVDLAVATFAGDAAL
jgi:hypothetical protein